jgi:hypothetical protein
VKSLVLDDKWLAAISRRVTGEVTSLTHSLVARVQQLGERYAETVGALDRDMTGLPELLHSNRAFPGGMRPLPNVSATDRPRRRQRGRLRPLRRWVIHLMRYDGFTGSPAYRYPAYWSARHRGGEWSGRDERLAPCRGREGSRILGAASRQQGLRPRQFR